MNFTTGAKASELLSLDHIRSQLIRLEDTIIFSLIERAQFARNAKIYEKGAFRDIIDFDGSWVEWFLLETEIFHAKARRFTSPDEFPFTPLERLPQPVIPVMTFPRLLYPPAASKVRVNDQILRFYCGEIVPGITSAADDGNYGSAATRDVEVLQALSRRIHFGMFVAESKFLSAPHDFIPHILSTPPNGDALAGLITKPEVEAKLLVRLGNKAKIYGGEFDADGKIIETSGMGKIDVQKIVDMYRDHVIPLTKVVEVEYLVHRLDDVPQSQIDAWMQSRH
ncbi:chorismate mutase [Kockovaella imperatae]|uniref:Chorismate mutase n=1 Tax=Kockovaella imperatae TaxID=4999 RepID=A0A1Y1UTK3_9TREE|nr:chorismate mutase [Kockovaella imperatae]ORX40937.1 chorismate mutase [Kockovaella imperatae]